jgi:hypothetical protein
MRVMAEDSQTAKWPARQLSPKARRAYIESLIDELETAERNTDPTKGPDTGRGKDHQAFHALLTAGELVRVLAGWAIDHVCGLSLAEEKLLSLQPSQVSQDQAYQSYRDFADEHQHEESGGSVSGQPQSLTDGQKQMILRNLLFGGASAFPEWLRFEALEGMDALRFGEVTGLFQPTIGTRRKVGYRELRIQLRAIGIVRFRTKLDGSKNVARREVADCFGVDVETLRSWEKRLPGDLGEIEFKRELAFAENRASHVIRARKLAVTGRPTQPNKLREYESALNRSEMNLNMYGDRALKSAADDHRRVRRVRTARKKASG